MLGPLGETEPGWRSSLWLAPPDAAPHRALYHGALRRCGQARRDELKAGDLAEASVCRPSEETRGWRDACPSLRGRRRRPTRSATGPPSPRLRSPAPVPTSRAPSGPAPPPPRLRTWSVQRLAEHAVSPRGTSRASLALRCARRSEERRPRRWPNPIARPSTRSLKRSRCGGSRSSCRLARCVESTSTVTGA